MCDPKQIPVAFDPFRDGVIEFTVPSTASQQEIWTSMQMANEAQLAFNESVTVRVPAVLDAPSLEAAYGDLQGQHDALRSCFSPLGRTLIVTKPRPPKITYHDLRGQSQSSQTTRIKDLQRGACSQVLDPARGPMHQLVQVQLEQSTLLILTAHHIICDGWSLAILIKDLARFYSARVQGHALPRRTVPAHMNFSDYAQRDFERQHGPANLKTKAYWTDLFRSLPPPLELPLKGKRPKLRSFHAQRYDLAIDQSLWANSKKASAALGCSHLAYLLSLFQILISKLSMQSDIVCGVPAAGQAILGQHGLVGHCVNLLPIRLVLAPDDSFRSVCQRMKATLLGAYEHQEYTFGSLLQELRIERDPSRLPLVSMLFNVDQQLEAKDLDFAGAHASYEANPRVAENFELFVNISESKDRVILECQYNNDLFSEPLIETFFSAYTSLLRQVVQHAGEPLTRLTLLDTPQATLAWNQTQASYPKEHTLDTWLLPLIQARGTREVCAGATERLSGQGLYQRSLHLAQVLHAQGVKRGDLVGLCAQRSPSLLAGVLAIWKVGAAYVPLDPTFPAGRLHYMIDDARIKVCMSQPSLRHLLPPALKIVDIDRPSTHTEADLPADHSPEDIAYVIYTSGSTGQPKGVMIQHRAVINFLCGIQKHLKLSADDRLLAVTTLSFDISVLELYLPLLTGAGLYIASSDEARDGDQLNRLIDQERISCMQATPSTWRMLLAAGANGLKLTRPFQALCGGEALTQELARDLKRAGVTLWNMYGPTEATVWATLQLVEDPEQTILIGRPLSNYQVYILNHDLALQPPGVPGDLYIGGEGLALGYLNRPELTQERFLEQAPHGLGRLYKTGDLARFTFDGSLEIYGRSDDQVKVRGYRIELGEVEKAIANHPQITTAVVVVREDQVGDQRLIAYMEARGDVSAQDLRTFVGQTLPAYMIPQQFVTLERLPLLPNGKLDRKSLPSPQDVDAVVGRTAAVTTKDEFEATFLRVWLATLGAKSTSETDHFFMVGGHSLLAIQMVAKLNQELHCNLHMRDVFIRSTFAELLLLAKSQAGKDLVQAKVSPRPAGQKAELSLLQQRMWYLELLDHETRVHNLPGAWLISGDFKPEVLQQAFARLLLRHEALQSTLVTNAGAPEVVFHATPWLPTLIDLSDEHDPMQACQKDLDQRALEKIALDQFPLFRCVIYRLTPTSHVLFLMIHHAIWDGWCFDLFLQEIGLHYQAIEQGRPSSLAPLAVQYYDFAAWHRQVVNQAANSEALKFWVKNLSPIPEPLDIPTDYPRPPLQSHQGWTLGFHLNEAELRACEDVARAAQVTLFSLFLSCYKLLLQRFSKQPEIVVGVPLRGRHVSELEHVLGLFINVLPVRTRLQSDDTFLSLVQKVHHNCTDAFAHGEVLLETIVAALSIKRDDSRTPLYSTMFSYQDVTERVQSLAGCKLKQLSVSSDVVHVDQMLWMKRGGLGVDGGIDFRTDLWDIPSMEQFRTCFCEMIRQLPHFAKQTLAELDLMPANIRSDLLSIKGSTPAPTDPRSLSQLLDFSRFDANKEALVAGTQRLSYGELQARTEQLAGYLMKQGIKSGDFVGICLHRHADLVTAMLAVLRLGAAYLPLDPYYPAERLAFMLQHSQARVVLTEADLMDLVPASQAKLIVLDQASWRHGDATAPTVSPPQEDQAAYVIYTSGSTGQPKGVVVSRRALSNFLQGTSLTLKTNAEQRVIGLTTISFDISIQELFGSLIVGACHVLIDQETSQDGEALARLISSERISLMLATPATWGLLLAAGWTGQHGLTAISTGEALPKDLATKLVGRCGQLWNAYGPTEATVWATLTRIEDPSRPILIGRPLPGYRVYILDDRRQLQLPGAWGQLFLGGLSLANGYIHQDAMTAERFVTNPFAAGERIYDTGDIARMRSDGQIEYLGRRDHQVKVRGFRIELGEIEACLSTHQAVDQAVVVVRGDKADDRRLVAYVVARPNQDLHTSEMQRFLGAKIPKYMIPNQLVLLPGLPLTENGKIDRKSLPAPTAQVVRGDDDVHNAAEGVVAGIWRELLHVGAIGRGQTFFELGGHSLLSVQAIHRINQLSKRPLKLRDLLTGTLAQVAALCDFSAAKTTVTQNIEKKDVAN